MERTEERNFPRELDVGRGARDKHDFEGPFARQSVSDVNVVLRAYRTSETMCA